MTHLVTAEVRDRREPARVRFTRLQSTCCMTLCKLINCAGPQFAHLLNVSQYICLARLLWILEEMHKNMWLRSSLKQIPNKHFFSLLSTRPFKYPFSPSSFALLPCLPSIPFTCLSLLWNNCSSSWQVTFIPSFFGASVTLRHELHFFG